MTAKENAVVLLFLAMFVDAGFLAGMIYGDISASTRCRERAIAAGVGFWTVNSTNGVKVFVYGRPQ